MGNEKIKQIKQTNKTKQNHGYFCFFYGLEQSENSVGRDIFRTKK